MIFDLNKTIFNYEGLKIIPIDWMPTKLYTMTFEGWGISS